VIRELVFDQLRVKLRDGKLRDRLVKKLQRVGVGETELETAITSIDARLMARVDVGKETLRRWLKDSVLRCSFVDGTARIEFEVVQAALIMDVVVRN